jgi:hypothetical protein
LTATYDPALSTDRDWVRLLVNDTDDADAKLENEEIDALLVEEANKYLAAAAALEVLYTRWASAGEGVMEKMVDEMRIKRGVDSPAAEALQARIDSLRAKGARKTSTSPAVFKVL